MASKNIRRIEETWLGCQDHHLALLCLPGTYVYRHCHIYILGQTARSAICIHTQSAFRQLTTSLYVYSSFCRPKQAAIDDICNNQHVVYRRTICKAKDRPVCLGKEVKKSAESMSEGSGCFLGCAALPERIEEVCHGIVVEEDLVRDIQRYADQLETAIKNDLHGFRIDEDVEFCSRRYCATVLSPNW